LQAEPAAPGAGAGPTPEMSLRARAVLVDGDRVLLDRTHHPHKAPFYWLPGGGVEPGETAVEAVVRELREEASMVVAVDRLLYVSENLFVEDGDYRHETILYFLARLVDTLAAAPTDHRDLGWHHPGELDGPLLPPDVAHELAHDLATGFRRPVLHLVTDERPR
jgi:ADP-ribose pyrophosphatase YjhB (NUDIX family)